MLSKHTPRASHFPVILKSTFMAYLEPSPKKEPGYLKLVQDSFILKENNGDMYAVLYLTLGSRLFSCKTVSTDCVCKIQRNETWFKEGLQAWGKLL